jgi:hypothetical protein
MLPPLEAAAMVNVPRLWDEFPGGVRPGTRGSRKVPLTPAFPAGMRVAEGSPMADQWEAMLTEIRESTQRLQAMLSTAEELRMDLDARRGCRTAQACADYRVWYPGQRAIWQECEVGEQSDSSDRRS